MRDGWIDEPMRPNIGKHSFKRMIEAKWELKVLKQATVIFVTYIIWKNRLEKRLPTVARQGMPGHHLPSRNESTC